MEDHVALDIERLGACLGDSHFQKNGTSSSLLMQNQFFHLQQHHHHHQDHSAKPPSPPSLKSQQDECRICQEEDEAGNLEIPCSCCGSLKYAHRKCVQRWCNEKGDTICEICQQPFKGYTAPVRSPAAPVALPDDHSRNVEWRSHHQLDPRIMAMAAERHFIQEIDDYAAANASGAACCRSAALILMALLLLRHTLALGAAGSDDDASTFFTLFFLRAAGFLLPCYIMARAMNILQRRRQRQEWSTTSAARSLQILDPSPSQSQRIPFLNLLASARG
ncbi:uncharacterized protein LOC112350826 [Selaginella moellendorffii]|uniref:uncharacterized protein LOC112350826 n=1 Tax=Selaginella moellendorffii TaxID=88036 RepID=UPI000D1CCB49|nr:uncharacterized protein LOC112350826 [Selaginella moellendorffii]|eukprot:XP_024543511.1 uncharacterized protein LOC112350826 [Selaginella moellendorffii]